jgi:transcriptional antiterminator RfaH
MWYAVYTKPRSEETVAFQLQNIGLDVLNPKLKSLKYKNNKFLEVIEPLFSCYLFANFDKDKYSHLITYTRGVRHIVGKNHPVPVLDEVINTIKEGMGEDNIMVVQPRKFKRGDKILVREGPFKDFYGIFEREIRGPDRVMILLATLNCRIELDSCFLAVA